MAEHRPRLTARQALRLVDAIVEYGICMLDRDGTVATWSAGAERIHGYRSAEIVGRPFAHLFTPEDQAAMLALLLDPAGRLERASLLRKALLADNPLRCSRVKAPADFKAEELAEVLTTGGPDTGLPSLVDASGTWAADPALCDGPPAAEV